MTRASTAQLSLFPKDTTTNSDHDYSEQAILFRRSNQGIPTTTYGTFGLYRYPAKFIPQVISYALAHYAHDGMSVFDPFAGYGTVGVVSKVYGHDYELWDLSPLLEVLHAVATMERRDIDIGCLLHEMASSTQRFLPDWPNVDYWFPQEVLELLARVWGFYHSLEDIGLKRYLVIPLLKTTRFFSYNDAQRQKLSKSPRAEKRVRTLLATDWQELFYRRIEEGIETIVSSIKEYEALGPKPVNAFVRGGIDTLLQDLDQEKDILITSPPYLQAQEYIRHAKMDLFWLGYSEETVRNLGKKEIPYRDVAPCPIYSETYHELVKNIQEPHIRRVFERYFYGILGALSRLQEGIRAYLLLFVGPASLRGHSVPIDRIFMEHFTNMGWVHEVTLKDTIVTRQMFFYNTNPATGLKDQRMRTESLIVLRRQ